MFFSVFCKLFFYHCVPGCVEPFGVTIVTDSLFECTSPIVKVINYWTSDLWICCFTIFLACLKFFIILLLFMDDLSNCLSVFLDLYLWPFHVFHKSICISVLMVFLIDAIRCRWTLLINEEFCTWMYVVFDLDFVLCSYVSLGFFITMCRLTNWVFL